MDLGIQHTCSNGSRGLKQYSPRASDKEAKLMHFEQKSNVLDQLFWEGRTEGALTWQVFGAERTDLYFS